MTLECEQLVNTHAVIFDRTHFVFVSIEYRTPVLEGLDAETRIQGTSGVYLLAGGPDGFFVKMCRYEIPFYPNVGTL